MNGQRKHGMCTYSTMEFCLPKKEEIILISGTGMKLIIMLSELS